MASYTFRNFSCAQMIGFLKQLNISELNAKNVKDHLPSEAEQEAAAMADYATAGIHLHAGGVIPFTKDDDGDIREKFEYAKRAKLAVIVGGDIPVAVLPRVEKFVKEYDIPVGIHNHGPEDKLWPSPMDVLKAVQNLDRRLGCCIDVGHCVRAGTDVVEAIRAAGPRLWNVHMKDLTDFHDRESQVAVGDGKMPVRGIFEALRAIHYAGFVDLEYEVHADDPMPGVEKSFTFLRKTLAEMDAAG
jgi:sugar phosphate isomerase/epimerase